jgi:hypothetical protein
MARATIVENASSVDPRSPKIAVFAEMLKCSITGY